MARSVYCPGSLLRDVHSARRPALRPACDRRRAAPAAGRARGGRQHGCVDRHLPRGAGPDPRRHVRVPDRQRGWLEGRRQPPAPGDQPGERRAAIEGRAVPDLQASRWTTASRTPIAHSSTASSRSSSSAATRTSASRGAWSTRGSCVKRSAGTSPSLAWAGGPTRTPMRPARSVTCCDAHVTAEFYLTQIVSHHSRAHVEGFLAEGERRGLSLPGMFGVFYYRSANPQTLRALSGFLPVPVDELTREFADGATPEEICARSIHALTGAGAKHFYVSNLPLGQAAAHAAADPGARRQPVTPDIIRRRRRP